MRELFDKVEAGRRIQAARIAKGLTQRQAAELLGVAVPTVYQLESGAYATSWTRYAFVVATLGLDPRIVLPELFSPLVKILDQDY